MCFSFIHIVFYIFFSPNNIRSLMIPEVSVIDSAKFIFL